VAGTPNEADSVLETLKIETSTPVFAVSIYTDDL